MKRRFVLYVLLILPLTLWASGSVDNIGFEDSLKGWKRYTGYMYLYLDPEHLYYQIGKYSIDDVRLWNEVPEDSVLNRFKLMNNSDAHDAKCSVISLSSILGNKFLKLGDSNYGLYCEKVSYTFAYDESKSIIKYAYALVMEEPGHVDPERPSFIASVKVLRNGQVLTKIDDCSDAIRFGNHTVYTEMDTCSQSSVISKDWTYNTIDLGALELIEGNNNTKVQVGDSIVLSFASFNCSQGGHYGYAYVDAEFVNSNFEIAGVSSNKVCMGETQKFSYPGARIFVGERYTWKVDDVPVSENSEDPTLNYVFTTAGKHKISLNIDVDGADESSCQSHQTITDFVEVIDCVCPDNNSITIDGLDVSESIRLCKNQLINIAFHSGSELNNPQYVWSYNEQSISDDGSFSYTVENSGELSLSVTSLECKESINLKVDLNVDICSETACNDCPSKFSPKPGEKYVVGGWVNAPAQLKNSETTSFTGVYIEIRYSDGTSAQCYPKGNIIDGWQRISETIVIPEDASKMTIALKNNSGAKAYFDDIRFHPFNATMKSYVYDPETLRLSAELDDENYATFYDYDEEGALVRVRKETERGVMTIQEARQSTYKTK